MKTNLQVRQVITDRDVGAFVAVQKEFKFAKEQMEKLKAELDIYECDLIAQIDAGAVLACHLFQVTIRDTERRFPAWKEHYIDLAGKSAADQVLEGTEAKVYRNLVVKDS